MIVEKLNTGITFIADKVPSAKSACIGFFVKAGSVDEDSSNYGISHIIEHMMFKGTPTRNYHQISEEFDVLGAEVNAFTSEEYTCYHAKVLPENLVRVADIYIDALMNSCIDKDELSRELKVILEEYKMYEDMPRYKTFSLFNNVYNKGTSFEVDVIGTEETIANTTREKILDYMSKHYCAENVVVCVSGKFDEDEIKSHIENSLILPHTNKVRNLNLNFNSAGYLSAVKDIEQSHVMMGCHIFGEDDARKYAMMILSGLMGGTMSSRLFKNIREEKGLAYSVHSMTDFAADTGTFYISAAVSHENVELTIESIKEELIKLKEFSFDESEFVKAKNIVKSNVIFKYEDASDRMVKLGSRQLLNNNCINVDEIGNFIDTVTYRDVLNMVDFITDISNYSCVVLSNREIDIKSIL